ncbi:hemerythrin domain-containing protein [Endozoicomonas sp. Mp262]|uniref:hemerythrin domain-containing protein n=1 Tax=Endozoicomonas sp. Mp262 TaxID=2919499 RepID=UPI0021E0F41D
MSRLIERIIQDHEHIARLLDCLDYEVAGYREGADYSPKLPIIQDALDYLYNYCDVFHHPLESRLMARLRPKLKEVEHRVNFELIEEQHKQIRDLSGKLLESFNRISFDQVIPINLLLSEYQLYSKLQRSHMRAEQNYMIPAMQTYLTGEDLLSVEEEIRAHPDPLFGAHIWEAYEDLYQHILKYARVVEPA